jgi:hypothetical protein
MYTKEQIEQSIKNLKLKERIARELSLELIDESSRYNQFEEYKKISARINELEAMKNEAETSPL